MHSQQTLFTDISRRGAKLAGEGLYFETGVWGLLLTERVAHRVKHVEQTLLCVVLCPLVN